MATMFFRSWFSSSFLSRLISQSKITNGFSSFFRFRRSTTTYNLAYLIPVLTCSGFLYKCYFNRVVHCSMNSDVEKFEIRRDKIKLQTIMNGSKNSWWSSVYSIICHVVRFFQLLIIFSPVVFLYPFKNSSMFKQLWLDCLVKAIERAGVVWIKCFQYMSHRRDIIGVDMAEKFVHLRQHAPEHSFKETEKIFKKHTGKKMEQIFTQFDKNPIASGSVSQVYKAKYNEKKVAIKVRHPGVQKHIQRDVNILFFFSRFLSKFSAAFRLPVSQVSMKKTLIDQMDFNNQKDNLLIFNQMFKDNKSVEFPLPIIDNTNEAILVESFVEGEPITFYEKNPHQLNIVMARLGALTFFQMLMKNNFIHADCHGGNIIVSIQQRSYSFYTEIRDYLVYQLNKLNEYFVFHSLPSEMLRRLYLDTKKEEQKVRRLIKREKQKVVVYLIDVGMVIRLDQKDRMNFISFLKCVLLGDGQKCADMIYNMSSFDGKKILKGNFDTYLIQLKSLFSALDGQPVQKLQGVQLMMGMLDIIRNNNMKLQGEFATLLTNMLVLEATAKQLDPNINILKCAIPFFRYVEDPDLKSNF